MMLGDNLLHSSDRRNRMKADYYITVRKALRLIRKRTLSVIHKLTSKDKCFNSEKPSVKHISQQYQD